MQILIKKQAERETFSDDKYNYDSPVALQWHVEANDKRREDNAGYMNEEQTHLEKRLRDNKKKKQDVQDREHDSN